MSKPQDARAATGPAPRAGRRALLALLGTLLLAVAAVPLALLVRAVYPPLVDTDRSVSSAAEAAISASAPLLAAARAVTLLGDPRLVVTGGVVAVVALLVTRQRRLAAFAALCGVGGMLLSSGLKLAVDRARPVFDMPVDSALGASFPSGHTLGASVFFTAGAVLLAPRVARPRLLVAAAVGVAVLVGLSRVLLGVHYPSDVVGGLLLGLGWTALCTAIFTAWRSEQGRPADPLEHGVGA